MKAEPISECLYVLGTVLRPPKKSEAIRPVPMMPQLQVFSADIFAAGYQATEG